MLIWNPLKESCPVYVQCLSWVLAVRLQQLKVIELVAVLHDVLLDLAADGPGNEVFSRSSHQICRICDCLSANADVALLNHLGGRLDRLGHAQPRHNDGEAAAGKGGHGSAMLDGRKLRGRRNDAHIVELVEEELLVFAADGIIGGEEGQAVGELAEGLQNDKVS